MNLSSGRGLVGKPKAVIFGISGTELTKDERVFFTRNTPLGFILFSRNCDNPEQVKSLTSELRKISGDNTLILIDQEGGRVARLCEPHWRKPPAPGVFAELAERDFCKAEEDLYSNYRSIADDLFRLGINVNCAPMLDIMFSNSHNIIGDRALGKTAEQVSKLGRVISNALMDGGVLPVIKHIPGHGRAMADSHESLPEVKESFDELMKNDFVPFRNLRDVALAMTAHIKYSAIDDQNPATLSSEIIRIIRENIGFSGLLMTDDISMKALSGSPDEISERAIAAGCDIILHCNGKMEEMELIAESVPQISSEKMSIIESALNRVKKRS